MEVEQLAAAASGAPSHELEDSPAQAPEARRRVDDADGSPGTKRTPESGSADASSSTRGKQAKSVLKNVDNFSFSFNFNVNLNIRFNTTFKLNLHLEFTLTSLLTFSFNFNLNFKLSF